MILFIVRKVLNTNNLSFMIIGGLYMLVSMFFITKSDPDFTSFMYVIIPSSLIFITSACGFFGLTNRNLRLLFTYIILMSIFATATIYAAVRVTDFAEHGQKDMEIFVDDKKYKGVVILITYIYRWILKKVTQNLNKYLPYNLIDLNKPLARADNVEILLDVVRKTGYVLIGISIYELVGILSAIYICTKLYALKKIELEIQEMLKVGNNASINDSVHQSTHSNQLHQPEESDQHHSSTELLYHR